MECHYCHTFNRKFYCDSCLTEKLHDHDVEVNPILKERDEFIKQAGEFVNKAANIHALLAEKNRRARNLAHIAEERQCIRKECDGALQRIQQLRAQIQRKHLALEQGEHRLEEAIMAQSTEWPKELANLTKRWQRIHKFTAAARCVLVNEIVTLFEFKPGVVVAEQEPAAPDFETSTMPFAKREQHRLREDLYICGVTLPARPIDVSSYSKEELNTAIGLVIHMLNLIVRYLGIKLPFMVFRKGIYPYVRSSLQPRNYSKMPLYLDDKNLKRFTIGIAMLNYDIAYLCHTQGVEIPISKVSNTLQGLMACCRSHQLGVHSHTLAYQGLLNVDFGLDLHQVLRMTALRYRSSATDVNKELVRDGLLNDSYFKVRPNNSSYEGLLDDSDEDIQDDDDGDSSSENWNLVDVMPSFGRPNGESESIFQLGATIMPGVLGMMESLGGRHMMTDYPNHGSHAARRKH
ncbi:hypothetical protein DFQ28_001653 [Apophysomyces sp. BC1034]|nr:hypothetical protein DFQ30_002060 [Apophysomyces sp. BC1015]KAG0179898.1 hypothetical protein DFQ29_001514 [Apophysomyces sp. BC1021]KAG0190722.1 hypothetical protein DFQ28_001653 [Apophysomyces sp. BC1034]